MNRLILIPVISMLTVVTSFSQIRWQTTRDGASSGNCRLQVNRFKIIVHPLHVDVEEDAEITTTDNVWSGDSRTLEIINEFSVSPGTAIRSMLLWNGDKILKAKLKLKDDADKEYEEVVEREEQIRIPRDPAIIEYIGNNRYRCRIYPVEAGGTRKIRILYTVPLRITGGVPKFEINTIFTVGAVETPGQIPVYIVKSDDAFTKYILKGNTIQKTITFGSVYMLSYQEMVKTGPYSWSVPTNSSISIIPDKLSWNSAWLSKKEEGSAKGYYTATVLSTPDTVTKLIKKQLNPNSIKLQAGITIGKKNYLADIGVNGFWSVYCKADSMWDGFIHWTGYNNNGNSAFTFDQKITPISNALTDSVLPLVWGMKYTLDEGNGYTGALFGFIDPSMSLLALESDTISMEAQALWSDEGVPQLLPEEIVVNNEKLPKTPKESVIFDFGTSVVQTLNAHIDFNVFIDNEGFMKIVFPDDGCNVVSIKLLDIAGRIVHEWKTIHNIGKTFNVRMPGKLNGFYIVQIKTGNNIMHKKVVVK